MTPGDRLWVNDNGLRLHTVVAVRRDGSIKTKRTHGRRRHVLTLTPSDVARAVVVDRRAS